MKFLATKALNKEARMRQALRREMPLKEVPKRNGSF